MTHHITQSSAPTSQAADQEQLTHSSLEDFFPELTDNLCERFSALFDFYVEGRCESAIQAELDQHRASCERCSTLYARRNEWRSSLVQGVEDMQSTITTADAEASLRNLLESRWDELGLDDLELDDLRDVVVEGVKEDQEGEVKESSQCGDDEERRSTIQLLDESEPPVKRRIKRRVVSLACTVAAAAFLFAYGPAFIETNVTESEPAFPVAQSSESAQEAREQTPTHQAGELPRWTPLMNHIGATVSIQGLVDGEQLSLTSCVSASPETTAMHTSSQLRYTLSLSTSPAQTIHVDLSSRNLTSAQRTQLQQRQRGAVSDTPQADAEMTSLKRSQAGNLQLIEYVYQGRHYQWSTSLSAPKGLLSSIAKLHRAR